MRPCVCAAIALGTPLSAFAQAAFEPMPRPEPGTAFEARHISSDGRVIAGIAAGSSFKADRLFRWTAEAGYEFIPGPVTSGIAWLTVTDVSADGSVICGFRDNYYSYHGFVATEEWGLLPPAFPSLDEFPRSISANGGIIVGDAFVAHGSSYGDTILWENGAATTPFFIQPWYSEHYARVVSGDAEHVYGSSRAGTFHFQRSTGSLSYLASPGYILDCTPSGDIVVGAVEGPGSAGRPAFWRNHGSSGPVLLHPTAIGYAVAVSGDGARIVGYVRTATGKTPFLWEPGAGLRSLHNVLLQHGVSVPAGWILETSPYYYEDIGISADGRTIVGTGQPGPGEPLQAFRVILPPICPANCDGSVRPAALTVADLTCFLERFAAGDPYANCDGSTTAPVLTHADLSCFLQKYIAGCP